MTSPVALTEAQIRKQNEISFFALKLEQKLSGKATFSAEEILALELIAGAPVTQENASASAQTLMSRLADFRNTITQYYDATGNKIKNYDLNDSHRTSDDVQALQAILGSRTGAGAYDKTIDTLQVQILEKGNQLRAIPANTTDPAQIKLRTKLQKDISKAITKINGYEVKNGTQGRTKEKYTAQLASINASLTKIPADTTNRRQLIARANLLAKKDHYEALVAELNVAAGAEAAITAQRTRLVSGGATSEDMAVFNTLLNKGVNQTTLNAYEQSVVNPRSFDLGFAGFPLFQDIKGSYGRLANTNTRAEVINAYTNILYNGVDGLEGLELSSDHDMTRGAFVDIATNPAVNDLRNMQVSTMVAITKFYDDATRMVNKPVAYEALGSNGNNGIGIVFGDPKVTDAKIMQYINYAYANPRLSQAQYNAYAQTVNNQSATI